MKMYLTFFDRLLYSGFMKNKIFLWEQSLVTFAVFGLIGGFLESYTFVLHGNVFCNAQTGNLVLLVINLIDGKAAVSLKYLFSILAYAAGILLSVVIPRKIKAISRSTFMTFLEILVLVGLAVHPLSPHRIIMPAPSWRFCAPYSTTPSRIATARRSAPRFAPTI